MQPRSRAECIERDRVDSLAAHREQFRLPEDVIYLDGNSLGALTRSAERQVAAVMQEQWGVDLIRSWSENGWLDYPSRLGDRIAPLIGASPGEVLVCDSTSIDLFKIVSAVALQRGKRRKLVTELGNFPTDLYVLRGLARLVPELDVVAVPREELSAAIDHETLLVVLTHVHYRTAEMYDLAAMTAHVHSVGARIVWDLSHSIGALPIDLGLSEGDFAVGCTYKYLNGGPGAPGFLYVRRDLQAALQPVLSGWLGDARPFDFLDDYLPAPGIDRHRCGTPPVLAYAALEGALDVFDGVDVESIRRKSIELSDLFIALVEDLPQAESLHLVSPRDPARRGSHLSFAHADAGAVMQRLIKRGVIGDFRAPDLLRFGLTPLYLRFVDVWDAVQILGEEIGRTFIDKNKRRGTP
jgi:kynureninase